MSKRAFTILLTGLLLLTAVAPAGAATVVGDSSPGGVLAQADDANNTEDGGSFVDTNGTFSRDDSSSPGTADSVRVTPITFNEDWLGIETTSTDEAFNTSGPFVMLSLSEPAENVRISQSKAEARLLEGGQIVRVEYNEDAAPPSSQSYFELEIFFNDGTTTAVDLYAEKTGVSASATEYEAYSGLIDDMEDRATSQGFEATPEGLENYHDWQVERVQIIESLLVERAAQLFGAALLLIRNPLAWVIALLAITIVAYKREQAHGWILDRIENDAGETARKHEQMKVAYREHREAANEEYIGDLDEVNDQQAQYWSDAFDVWSIHQLAELARRGPRDLDEEVVADGGEVESALQQIKASEIHDSWLSDAFSTNRLSTPQEALSQMRASLIRMEANYGMGHIYGETRSEVEKLLREVKENEGAY